MFSPYQRNFGRQAVALMLFLQALCFASLAQALTASQVPLFLSAQVKPNVIMAVDDSGSMDAELLLPSNDGAAWWHTGANYGFWGYGVDSDYAYDVWYADGRLNFNQAGGADGTWKKFIYLFPNGNNSSNGGRAYSDSNNDHYAIPPIPMFAYARSVEYNGAYFNPAVYYAPWPSVGGQTFSNMPAAAAKWDPGRSGSLSYDLTQNIEMIDDNHKFRLFDGMKLPVGTKIYLNGAWRTLTVEDVVPVASSKPGNKEVKNNVSYPISYFPAVFYCKDNCPAADYGYTAVPELNGFSPGAIDADMYRYEIKPENFSSGKYEVAIQNFSNWFSYYRKRQLATRGGLAAAFKDMTTIRAGTFRINNRKPVTMYDLSVSADRDTFFDAVMQPTASGGTPNRESLAYAGEQYMRTSSDAPIQYSCQANATILFTDGFSNASSVSPAPGNSDGSEGIPYADNVDNTMADIAMKYYKTPLRSDSGFPAGKVPVSPLCKDPSRPADTDCNSNLHMLTFGVTLGSKGILYDPDSLQNAYTNPPAWWSSFSDRSPRAVDDLWHATINGRGNMLTASTPTDVAVQIKTALSTFVARTGSSSAVATNSTRLDTGSYVYQAKFDSNNWSGTLLAYGIASTGQLDGLTWSTDDTNPAPASRNIVTWTGSAGVDFAVGNWASLSAAQRTALNNGDVDAVGQQRLNWLRGSKTLEESNGGVFRNRSKWLGDIVNSDPLFVQAEDYGFNALPGTEGSSYALWDKSTRTPMLYVGANDGMLHAFNANTGAETFAYIPHGVFGTVANPKLATLSNPGYTHQYFVDGTARASDAYINGSWKTVLLGSTGSGGKSVFAVNITNPGSLDASSVMWEYTTTGTTAGSPTIARLASGDWVAIFGNGYDSTENVKLNVVRLSDGVLLKAIDTGVSGANNGLAPPLPVDINNDRITDYVYVGDLRGNMWKFDLRDTNSSQWRVAYASGATPKPLITVTDNTNPEPITTRATAGSNPNNAGVMVYFGTGSYFADGDNVVGSSPQLQRFYGVLDAGATVAMSQLVAQTVTNEGVSNSKRYRVTSTNPVSYATKKGWYLNLQSPGAANGAGERVVSSALLRAGRVIFSTLTPSVDPCDYGGKSWLMELDAISGARLLYPVFDFNDDGVINDADMVTLPDGTKVPAGGLGFDEIIKTPGIIGAGAVEYKYTSGSSGTLGVTREKGSGNELGRQSWRQLQR